ncbi:MAG: hypothetical protein AMXMBFR64_19970 [Myxococcales bacterium]
MAKVPLAGVPPDVSTSPWMGRRGSTSTALAGMPKSSVMAKSGGIKRAGLAIIVLPCPPLDGALGARRLDI